MIKTKILIILLAAAFFMPNAVLAQEKLILKQGVKRSKLSSGMYLIPTFHKQGSEEKPAEAEIPKFITQGSQVWLFDSIHNETLYLSQAIHHQDTVLTRKEYRQLDKQTRNTLSNEWIRLPNTYVKGKRAIAFRKVDYVQKSYSLNEIESLCFARSKNPKPWKYDVYQGVVAIGVVSMLPISGIAGGAFFNRMYPAFITVGTVLTVTGSILSHRNLVKQYTLDKWAVIGK